MSWKSRWSLMADRSFGTILTSRDSARSAVGPPATLALLALVGYVGYLRERARGAATDRKDATT
jgi:hypothetical protein